MPSYIPCIGAHRYVAQRFGGDVTRTHLPVDEIVTHRRNCTKSIASSTLADGACTDAAIEQPDSAVSRALDAALSAHGLIREATQVTIEGECAGTMVAPILDVLCRDARGRAVPVEVKTGRKRRLRHRGARDRGARDTLHAFADTVALRHHAQLAVQALCLRRYGGSGCVGYLAYFPSRCTSVAHTPRVTLVPLNAAVGRAVAATSQ